jgi:hypothetical protein
LAALEGELRPLVTERIGAEKAEHFVNNWRLLVLVLERGSYAPPTSRPESEACE